MKQNGRKGPTTNELLLQAKTHIQKEGFHLMAKEDIPKFLDCIVEAYGGIYYPLDDYLVGHSCTKEDLREIWQLNLRYFHSKAIIYSDTANCNGWAMWIPPGFQGISLWNFIQCGGLKLIFSLGPRSILRIIHYESYSKSIRMRSTKGKEWYLYNLSVNPLAQGKHIASKLINSMLSFCAKDNTMAYLETHSEKNASMYQHFGFKQISNDPIPGTNVTHWAMINI